MPTVSLVWGVLAFLAMVFTLLPLLHPLVWINVFFAGIGVLLNVFVLVSPKTRADPMGIAGLVAAGIAFIISMFMLLHNVGMI